LTGTVAVGADGNATIEVELLEDEASEGSETLTVTIDEDATATADVTVNDTSVDPNAPIYALTADAATVDEGATATFTLATTNLEEDDEVAYTITGVEVDDIAADALTGTVAVDADGNATIEVELLEDEATEGPETLTVTIDEDATATADVTVNDTSTGQNVVDMAAGEEYTATDGVVDVFQYELDSSSGRAVGLDGEVSITDFNVDEDELQFTDEAGDTLTTENFTEFDGVSLGENPFADNTLIAFDPDEGVSSLITLSGVQDAALETIDFSVV